MVFPGPLAHTPGFDKDFSNHPTVRVIFPYPDFTAPPSTTIGSVTPYYPSLCLTSARKPVPEDSLTLLHRLEVKIEAFSWPSSCRPRSGTMDKLLPVLCWIRYHRNPSVPRPRRRRSRPAPQYFVFLVRTATSSAPTRMCSNGPGSHATSFTAVQASSKARNEHASRSSRRIRTRHCAFIPRTGAILGPRTFTSQAWTRTLDDIVSDTERSSERV
jgi:hypothetical protein